MPDVRLEKITAENLNQAIEIGKLIFPKDSEKLGCPELVYRWSVYPETIPVEEGTDCQLTYYLALNQAGTIVGITGLYKEPDDAKNARWLGWFGVLPEYRERGYGRSILEETERKALRRGIVALRLWTTEDAEEAAAQFLFEKMGYVIKSHEHDIETGYDMIIRAKNL